MNRYGVAGLLAVLTWLMPVPAWAGDPRMLLVDAIPRPDRAAATLPQAPANADGTVTIPLLVVWTAKAAAAWPGLAADFATAVAFTNQALRDSGANARLSLVSGGGLVAYEESGRSNSAVLADLTARASDGARQIESLRVQAGAAIVSVVADDAACGNTATIPIYADQYWYGAAHSVVTARAVACGWGGAKSEFLAKLWGHNLGVREERYVTDPTFASREYGFAYVDKLNRFRTLGSSEADAACRGSGFTCTRIPLYSNPALSYQGHPTGIAAGQTGAADSVRRMNELAPFIGAYGNAWPATVGFWWVQGESGRGIGLELGQRTALLGFYDYDATGLSRWRLVSCPLERTASDGVPWTGCAGYLNFFHGGQAIGGAYRMPVLDPARSSLQYQTFRFPTERPGMLGARFSLSDGLGNAVKPLVLSRLSLGDMPLMPVPAAAGPQSGWWWNPTFPGGGTGMFIETQAPRPGSTDILLFVVYYAFDIAGNPIWYASSGPMSASGGLFEGPLIAYASGSDFNLPNRVPVGTEKGTLTLQFSSPLAGMSTIALFDGAAQRNPIARFQPDDGSAGETTRFLSFPLICTNKDCRDEQYHLGAYTPGMITAVLDHSMKENVDGNGNSSGKYAYGVGDSVIVGFTGDGVGSRASGPVGDTTCIPGNISLGSLYQGGNCT